jgi:cyclopropane-fatty-acyl-phospholipid synthase
MHDQQLSSRYAAPGVPFAWRLLFRAAARLEEGRLEIVLPDRQRFVFEGARPGLDAQLVVRDLGMIRRIIARGDLGFAEAYLDGEWETPSLVTLLELMDRNRAAFAGAAGGRWLGRLVDWYQHLSRPNSRRGARRNIAAHYDLGNAFYALWLDPSMTYSSAIFSAPDELLEDAQRTKYRRLLDRLDLKPGQHLLEIGSGWGACAILAATEYGVRVTSLTLSTEQLKEATARAAAAGVADRVEFRLQDYRDCPGTFDAIVSCEMFEAVGERYWPTYFRTVHERLVPGGRAALQVITIGEEFFDAYRRGVDFIQRYIFPGGMLPAPGVFERRARDAGLTTLGASFHGADYARTLALWDRSVFAARPRLMELGFDARFMRMWHYYLAYCEAGFRTGHCDLMQTVLQRPH